MNDTNVELTISKLMEHSGHVQEVSTGFDAAIGAADQIGLNHKTILTSYGILMTPFVLKELLAAQRSIIDGMKSAKSMTASFSGKIQGFSHAVQLTDADNAGEIDKAARGMFGVRPGENGRI